MSPVVTYPEFSIELPAGWEDQTVPTFVGRRAGGFYTNLVVTQALQGERLGVERHAQKQLALIKEALVDYQIAEQQAVSHGGQRAYRVVHSFNGEDGKRVTQLQLYVERGERVWVATASAAAEVFDELRGELEAALDSLAFG